MIRRSAKIALEVAAGLFAVLVITLAVGAWRLSQGPVSFSFLTPKIEDALSDPSRDVLVDVDEAFIAWGGWERTLEVRATQVNVLDGARLLTELPEIAINLSAWSLLNGRVAPERIEIVGLQLTAVRREDGGVDLGLPGASDSREVSPSQDGLAFLFPGPEEQGPIKHLRALEISDAAVVFEDRINAVTWTASDLDLSLFKHDLGLLGDIRLGVDLPQRGQVARSQPIDFEFSLDRESGVVDAVLAMRGLIPAEWADRLPALNPLVALQVPLDINASVRGDITGALEDLQIDVSSADGLIDLPDVFPSPLIVDNLSGRVRLAAPSIDTPASSEDGESAEDRASTGMRTATENEDSVGIERRIPYDQISIADFQVDGEAAVNMAMGPHAVSAVIVALTPTGSRKVQLSAALSEVRPVDLASSIGALHGEEIERALRTIEMPVSARVTADVSLEDATTVASVALTAGAGTLHLPEVYPRPLALDGIELSASYDVAASAAKVDQLTLRLGRGIVNAFGDASHSAEQVDFDFKVNANAIPVEELDRLWPPDVGFKPRRWVIPNIPTGMVNTASMTISGAVPLDDPADMTLKTLQGEIDASETTLRYFHPLPPVTDAAANITFDAERFLFDVTTGRVGDVIVTSADIELSGLSDPGQFADITVNTKGPITGALKILNSDPFNYVDRLGFNASGITGTADSTLRFELPLINDLTYEQIDLGATSTLRNVGVLGAVFEKDITEGELELDLDRNGMTLSGVAMLDGMRSDVSWRESFVAEAPEDLRRRFDVKFRTNAEKFAEFGVDPSDYVSGPVGTTIGYSVFGNERSQLDSEYVLDDARVFSDALGFEKAPGEAATANVVLTLQDGDPVSLPTIRVVGDGIAVAGAAEFANASGSIARANFSRIALAGNDLRKVAFAQSDDAVAVKIGGGVLDLSTILQSDDDSPPDGKPPVFEPDLPFALSFEAALDAINLGAGQGFQNATVSVVHDGTHWLQGEVNAFTSAEKSLRLSFARNREPSELLVWIDDTASVAQSFGGLANLRNGTLALTASRDKSQPQQPFVGRVEMRDYQLVDAPILARLLTIASLTGILDLLSRQEGLPFSNMVADFSYSGGNLNLADARAYSPAIGITANGRLDLGDETLDLEGTIAPAYVLSQVIGTIPLFGDILTGGKGEGVFAATYSMDGQIVDPEISVNPLAALAPGFLRGIFGIFDSDDDADKEQTPIRPTERDDLFPNRANR